MEEVNVPELILKKFLDSMDSEPILGKEIPKELIDLILQKKCTKDTVEQTLKK